MADIDRPRAILEQIKRIEDALDVNEIQGRSTLNKLKNVLADLKENESNPAVMGPLLDQANDLADQYYPYYYDMEATLQDQLSRLVFEYNSIVFEPIAPDSTYETSHFTRGFPLMDDIAYYYNIFRRYQQANAIPDIEPELVPELVPAIVGPEVESIPETLTHGEEKELKEDFIEVVQKEVTKLGDTITLYSPSIGFNSQATLTLLHNGLSDATPVTLQDNIAYGGSDPIALSALNNLHLLTSDAQYSIPNPLDKEVNVQNVNLTPNIVEQSMSVIDIINTFHEYGCLCSPVIATFVKFNLLANTTLWKIACLTYLMQRHRFNRIQSPITGESDINRPTHRRAHPRITKKVLAISSIFSNPELEGAKDLANVNVVLKKLLNSVRVGKKDKNYLGMDYKAIKRVPRPLPIKDKDGDVVSTVEGIEIEQHFNKIIYS